VDKDSFTKVPGKYQLVEIDYDSEKSEEEKEDKVTLLPL
jgi:hypothetical protein